ncbi:MAG: undecaprenyl-diphosphate phosphatase [Firmicutes bacterium]|nr:undecaprenyl-diphosphate phosphatase [Bacillota bacterium]
MAGWQAVVLGLVQGVTEFLPISSSAHLVFVPRLLGIPHPPLAFDVLLHLGTLLAVVGYFARDLARLAREAWSGRGGARRLLFLLFLGSIPAAVLGLLAHDQIERSFAAPAATAWQLAFTGILLFLADRRRPGRERGFEEMGLADAFFIGIGQAVAIVPGISRSGATIAFGLWRGLGRAEAARFSFLLSIPAILGAGLVEARSIFSGTAGGGFAAPYLLGFLAAAAAGTAGIAFFLRHLTRGRLLPFAVYCWAAALAFLAYLALA